MNTIGNLFRLTTFGESHGQSIGGIIDGCPAGLELDFEFIQSQLDRRKPGQSSITTQRNEWDKVEFLSGIFEGKTTGSSIGFIIRNKDQKSKDYNHLKDTFRPSHGDYTYHHKYGIRDYRGGGRYSARETANWIVAGALAKQVLKQVDITAYVSSVGEIECETDYNKLDFSTIEQNIVRCPDKQVADSMINFIETVKKEGDSVGGVISCVVKNMPVGLGEPIFDKLTSRLAKYMMTINASKGFEIGNGFEASRLKGSQNNDIFESSRKTNTNRSGGIQAGISNGMDLFFRVAFKPASTLMTDQDSFDNKGNKVVVEGKGRHDPCVVPRAVPVVEAMTAMALVDAYFLSKNSKL
jgi:chorismate synthase